MKDFLSYLITQLVDHPKDVAVDEISLSDTSFQYLIHAHTQDVGKIIGKQGKIIQAIRNVAKIMAVKNNIQVRIEIA